MVGWTDETKTRIYDENCGCLCRRINLLCVLGECVPCIKLGYQFFQIDSTDTATQILFAGCRFAIAGLLTILFGSVLNRRWLFPKKQSWLLVVKLSLFQTILQYLFFYIGLAHTTGVKSSIIVGTNVFVSIVVASFIFRQEKMTIAKAMGCLIGFAGVVIVNLNGSGLDRNMSFCRRRMYFPFYNCICMFFRTNKRLFKKRESGYIKRLSVFLWRIGYDRLWTGGRWKTCPYNRSRDCNASLSWDVICNCLHSLGNLIKI